MIKRAVSPGASEFISCPAPLMTVSRACGRILSSSRAALMLALSRSPQAIDTGHSILASDGVKSRRAMSPVRDIICFLVSPEPENDFSGMSRKTAPWNLSSAFGIRN